MATPHISAAAGDFAKTVLMPGDPLRAKFIAETFLTDIKLVTSVRNMLGYTGLYKGKPVSVMASGMGMPSIGIYSYELFKFYDVENIIRIGSAGSYRQWLKVMDVTIADVAVSESSYARVQGGCADRSIKPSAELNAAIKAKAEEALKGDKAVGLLPVGVTAVEGDFEEGDIIDVVNPRGETIALGRSSYSADEARKVIGMHDVKPLIHYDYLYME